MRTCIPVKKIKIISTIHLGWLYWTDKARNHEKNVITFFFLEIIITNFGFALEKVWVCNNDNWYRIQDVPLAYSSLFHYNSTHIDGIEILKLIKYSHNRVHYWYIANALSFIQWCLAYPIAQQKVNNNYENITTLFYFTAIF